MKIWMSGEIDADVADDYRRLRQAIESAINARLAAISVGDSVAELAFIPIITSIARGLNPEVAKFRKRQKEAEFRVIVDHTRFRLADEHLRRRILLDALESCVRRLPELGASDVNVTIVSDCIRNVREGN
jgi:hypothetical protein